MKPYKVLPCSDFFGPKGVCTAGDACPLSHGENPVVLGGGGLHNHPNRFLLNAQTTWNQDSLQHSTSMDQKQEPLQVAKREAQSAKTVSKEGAETSQFAENADETLQAADPVNALSENSKQSRKQDTAGGEVRNNAIEVSVPSKGQDTVEYVKLNNLSALEECIKLASQSLRTGMVHALSSNGPETKEDGSNGGLPMDETELLMSLPRQRTEREWLEESLERRKEMTARKGEVYNNLLKKRRKVTRDGTDQGAEDGTPDDEVIVVSDSRDLKRVEKANTSSVRRRFSSLPRSIVRRPSVMGRASIVRRPGVLSKPDRAGSAALRKMKEEGKPASRISADTRLRYSRIMRNFDRTHRPPAETVARNIASIQRRHDSATGRSDDSGFSIATFRALRRPEASIRPSGKFTSTHQPCLPHASGRQGMPNDGGDANSRETPQNVEHGTMNTGGDDSEDPKATYEAHAASTQHAQSAVPSETCRNTYKLTNTGARPVVTSDSEAKVPLDARQYFADKLYALWIRVGVSEIDACVRTMATEEKIYNTSPTKLEYRSGCVSAVKEVKELLKRRSATHRASSM